MHQPQRNRFRNRKIVFVFRLWFKKYPALPYILKWTFISLCLGLAVGTVSSVFLQSLEVATSYREAHRWLVAILPIAGLGVGLLYHFAGKGVEAGNNLLIDSIHDPKKTIPFRMAPLVFFGTLATHFFGGSAGREGTALQMAGAIGVRLSKPFRLNESERKILLIAAVAAGFGSVFGTPLAGAVFGLEVFLIGRLKYDAIFPAFAASILADLVTKLWHTGHVSYPIGTIPDISLLRFLYAIASGIIFGICAALFSKSMHRCTRLFRRTVAFPPLRPFVGGIFVATAVGIIGTTKYIGLGIPTIVAAFERPLPSYDFIVKIIFTVWTLSAGFKGGEVTPLFFIGATLGNALSMFIPLPTGLLAGMGFVAVFAGATNTPIACTIMAMELFGSDCGVYVAVAVIAAYLVSGHNSIYNKQMIGEPKNHRLAAHRGKRLTELDPP